MNLEDQFLSFILREKEKSFIEYLKTLTPADKKLLALPIKRLAKEYNEWGDIGGGRWGHRAGSDKQRDMLQVASFVCHNRADFEKSPGRFWFIRKEKVGHILDWYVPDWFNDYLNKQASTQDFFSLDYEWIMELSNMGALRPGPEMVVKTLPRMLFGHHDSKGHQYLPEKLLQHPITLQEHIWYFFDYESSIHFNDRFILSKEGEQKQHWVDAFIRYSSEGKIDRQRLLKESLLATNKNFNKVLSGWFVDLFEKLEPTISELLALQKELVMVLNAPHSKPAYASIQYLKKIIGEKEVDIPAIFDALPVTLASNSKTLVSATLMLLEQIAKKVIPLRSPVTQLCCQVFIHADEAVQNRAAKIIAKYGDDKDESLQTHIASYRDALLRSPRKILESFFDETSRGDTQIVHALTSDQQTNAVPLQPIPQVETIDDLLFLAAQAFDNNESWHFDLLPAALVRLQHELKGPVLSQLQPALQRALKFANGEWRSTQGTFDHLLAIFFIDVCIHLVRKYPGDTADLQRVFANFDQKRNNEIAQWLAIAPGELYLEKFADQYKDIYFTGHQWLVEVMEKIRHGDDLPLLSTPTHNPGWIDPLVLIERLALYQGKKTLAEATDAQLAIGRCALMNTVNAVEAAQKKLNGELQRLFLFLLQPDAEPEGPFSQPQYWMMASLSKHPKKKYGAFESFGYYDVGFEKYTGQLSWVSEIEEYDAKPYDYKLRKYVTKMETRKHLRIDFPRQPKDKEEKKKAGLLSWLIKKPKQTSAPVIASPPSLIYDHFRIQARFLSSENNDIRRAMLMAPNNLEVLLPWILHTSLRYPTSMGEIDKRMVVAALQLLHEQWPPGPGEMAHLFIATAMLSLDKTSSGTAAEIWLRYAPEGKFDNALLGRIIGTHEKVEYAPLKRFTDLIMQSLFRISPQHNRMLQVVIENMLVQLPGTPIKGLKKLLEILLELVAVNKQPVEVPGLKEKLYAWKEVEGLRKVVESLENA